MMDWIGSRLSLKIMLMIVTLIFISVGSISLLLYQRSVIAVEKEAYGRLEETVRAYANQLDIGITNTMQITDTLGTLIREDFSLEKVKTEPGYLDKQIQRFNPYVKVLAQEFSQSKSAYVYYNWELDGNVHDIYYTDGDNNGSVERQKNLPAEYFTEKVSERGSNAWWFGPVQTRKGYWSPPYQWVFDNGSSTTFISYTRAVYEGNTLIGVTGTDFKYENLLDLMKTIKVYDTGYPFLLDGNKHFLIHPSQQGESLAGLAQEPFKTLREEIPFKTEGAFRFTEADGKTWFVTYYRLRNDWILGLAAPVSEVTESAGSLTFLILGILSISAPLICLAAFLTARHIAGPVSELKETVRKMEAGDYMPPMNPRLLKRKDELGRLGQALHQLGKSLDEDRFGSRSFPGEPPKEK